jgi:hypothetical protein
LFINIGLDVRNARNLGQIASNRDGTTTSGHVRHGQRHQPGVCRGRCLRCTWIFGCAVHRGGGIRTAEKRHRHD